MRNKSLTRGQNPQLKIENKSKLITDTLPDIFGLEQLHVHTYYRPLLLGPISGTPPLIPGIVKSTR